jgi:hypothetical protein
LLHAFKVIRVNRPHPLASGRLLHWNAYILDPLLIGVINQPVRAASVNDLGHGVGELAEARLALASRLFGQNPICIVENRADHAQRRALRVIEDTAPGFDPPVQVDLLEGNPKMAQYFPVKKALSVGTSESNDPMAPTFRAKLNRSSLSLSVSSDRLRSVISSAAPTVRSGAPCAS